MKHLPTKKLAKGIQVLVDRLGRGKQGHGEFLKLKLAHVFPTPHHVPFETYRKLLFDFIELTKGSRTYSDASLEKSLMKQSASRSSRQIEVHWFQN